MRSGSSSPDRGRHAAAHDAGLPRLFGLESEYEEQQMEAELHFVNGLVKEIESGDLEGLEMWRAFHADGPNPLEGVVFRLRPLITVRRRVSTHRRRIRTTTRSIHGGPSPGQHPQRRRPPRIGLDTLTATNP